jgi:hypothetical protein
MQTALQAVKVNHLSAIFLAPGGKSCFLVQQVGKVAWKG